MSPKIALYTPFTDKNFDQIRVSLGECHDHFQPTVTTLRSARSDIIMPSQIRLSSSVVCL